MKGNTGHGAQGVLRRTRFRACMAYACAAVSATSWLAASCGPNGQGDVATRASDASFVPDVGQAKAQDDEAGAAALVTCFNAVEGEAALSSRMRASSLRGRYSVQAATADLSTLRVKGYGAGAPVDAAASLPAPLFDVTLARVPTEQLSASEKPGPVWRGSFTGEAKATSVLTVRALPGEDAVWVDDRDADKGQLPCTHAHFDADPASASRTASPAPSPHPTFAASPSRFGTGPTGLQPGVTTSQGNTGTRDASLEVEDVRGAPPADPIVTSTRSGTATQSTTTTIR